MPQLDNARYELYAQALAAGETADKAYVMAGFKQNRGNTLRLKNNPEIKARVAELLGASAERVEISEAYVLGTIKDTVERCRQAVPVLDRKGQPVLVETADGDLVPAYVFDPKSVIRGAELLGKHIGMFSQRVEHTGADGGPIELEDKELARLIVFQLTKASKEA